MMSTPDDQTLRFYAETAPTYLASGPGGVSRHLPAFLAMLPERSQVLELGCGGGRDAAAMIAAGHDVDATDGSPAIAAKAAEYLGRPVRVMRFDALDAVADYDAIWANAALLHVPRADLPAILGRVWRALRPGGLHYASYKGGGVAGRDRFGRYFNYLSGDQLRAAYAASGAWDVLSVTEYMGGGYDTTVPGPWVAITARRPG